MTKKKGFTLIELLVVIAIIALLSTLAVVSLNNARAKSRDAKRVSDIKQLQTALELYFADTNYYPSGTATLGSTAARCLDSDGWSQSASGTASGSTICGGTGQTTYMGLVPSDPQSFNYVYSAASASATTYSIVFQLEAQTGSLGSGSRTATPPTGIQ